jgi:DNA-binding transcriptional MerR regulator
MTIGNFAQISGLSVHTLRHYDDVGLLAPADVDPATGYRRYRRSQVRDARIIKALRWIELPIEEIKLAIADPPERQFAMYSSHIVVGSSGSSERSPLVSPTSTTTSRGD